jgi:hypothetical protein
VKKVLVMLVGVAAVAALAASCGGDDGSGVRTLGCDESGSAASGSGTASGSAASGSESGSSAPESGSGAQSGSGASGSASGAECPSSGSGSASASASGVEGECEPVGDIATATSRVDVTLDEWTIEVGAPSTAAGQVGFAAQNAGEEPHELVVLTGVEADALPLDDDGALDEGQLPDGALIGEIEPFPGGESCDGVFELPPAEYVLVCNISELEEDGTIESHLKKGMLTTFTVT